MSLARDPFPENPSPALTRLLRLTAEILGLVRDEDWPEDETEAVGLQLRYLAIKLEIAEQDLLAERGKDDWDAWTFVGEDPETETVTR